MTRSLAAAVVATGLLALASGCSAGQITQTDEIVPAVPGVNVQTPIPGGQLAVRNAYVVYPGTQGYAAGSRAILSLRLFNNSPNPVRLRGGTSDFGTVTLGSAAAASPSPTASARPTAAPSTPAVPAAPAAIVIPPLSLLVLDAESPQRMTITLKEALKPGASVVVSLTFDDGVQLDKVTIPMDVPGAPAPRVPLVTDEAGHEA